MSDGEQQFIRELTKAIDRHRNCDEIISEYKQHIYEMKHELSQDDKLTYEKLVERLGSPLDIAKAWQQEIGFTSRKMQWLFVFINMGIFFGGIGLTVSYHFFELTWIDRIWNSLTDMSFIIMFVYMLFWGLLGYEIGREFGHRGHRLLRKTFGICIIPNILFMYLVVLKVLPYEWFDSLLNIPFIMICIIFTGFLYPISIIGYLWGRKLSV